MRAAVLVAVLMLCACGGSTATHSPSPTSSAPNASPPASPTTGPASLVHCTTAVPAGDNLVIGTVVGDPTVVVRDIQDPAHARNLCAFDSSVHSPQFVSGSKVAYETSANQIIVADLAGGETILLATYSAGFDSGQYAFSPDGKSMTYLDTDGWHLLNPTGNHVLAKLPAAPGRGVSPNQDDSFLAFSPDGQFLAYFQTFHVGGTGATAPSQIRKASDGSLVYSTSGATMAVWASVPSRLFFRTSAGAVKRWDPSAGVSSIVSEVWVRPQSSPDGRWIAYTYPSSGGVGAVGFFSVQSNGAQHKLPAGRSGPRFLTNDLVWYIGERACTSCFGGQPQATGVTYIYSIAGASEVTSRLASVSDVWPRVTAPAL